MKKTLITIISTTSLCFAAASSSSESTVPNPHIAPSSAEILKLKGDVLLNRLTQEEINNATDQLLIDIENDEEQQGFYRLLQSLDARNKTDKANEFLLKATQHHCPWALWIQSNSLRIGTTPTSLDYYLADRGFAEAEKIVDSFHNTTEVVSQFKPTSKRLVKKQINEFVIKWKQIGYGKPLVLLYSLLCSTQSKKNTVQLIETAAKLKNQIAMHTLGLHYHSQGNTRSALKLWHKNSILGDASSSFAIGNYLSEKSDKTAIPWFTKAAHQGSTDAMANLGDLLRYKDRFLALYWLEKASKLGSISAMSIYADLLREDPVTQKKAYELYGKVFLYLRSLRKRDKNQEELLIITTYALGEMNMEGLDSGQPDQIKALAYLKSIAHCHGLAAYNSSVLISEVQVQTPDTVKQRLQYLEQAVKLKNSHAMVNLGKDLLKKDKARAISLFKKAAKLKNSYGMVKYANYLFEIGNLAESLEWQKRAADGGNPIAMYNLGNIYYHRNPEFHPQAFAWFTKAANTKLDDLIIGPECYRVRTLTDAPYAISSATYMVGLMYEKGLIGQEPNYEMALAQYNKAMQMGDDHARHRLAIIARDGLLGQEKNEESAVNLLNEGVEKNCPYSIFDLSYYYSTTQNDKQKAIDLLQRIIHTDKILVLHNLGLLLHENPITRQKGIQYLTKAAHKGLIPSMCLLASIHMSSEIEKDIKKALFWTKRAAELGDENAKKYLEISATPAKPENEADEEQQISVLSTPTQVPLPEHNIPDLMKSDKDFIIPSSSDSEDESAPSSSSSSSEYIQQEYPAMIRNPKTIRANLKRMAQIQEEMNDTTPCLGVRAQGIADQILARQEVTHNDLRILFEDPAFGGKVDIYATKSGLTISTLQKTIGTHKAHKNSKTKAFQADVRKLLTTNFPWTQQQ